MGERIGVLMQYVERAHRSATKQAFSNPHEKEPLSQTFGLSNKASFSAPLYLRQQNKPLRRHYEVFERIPMDRGCSQFGP